MKSRAERHEELRRIDAWIRLAEKRHRFLLWAIVSGIAVAILELSIVLRLVLEAVAKWIAGGAS